jgi:thiol-disulfide isomerase/thioredoxin
MPIPLGTPLPEWSAVSWINDEPPPSALTGRPLLVHFWSVSCGVCHDNMPIVAEWRDTFRDSGLEVISFHNPRSAADRDQAKVLEHAQRLGLSEPCGLDHEMKTAEAFQNTFVPSYYLFDAGGHLRSRAGGSAGLAMMRAAIERYCRTTTTAL